MHLYVHNPINNFICEYCAKVCGFLNFCHWFFFNMVIYSTGLIKQAKKWLFFLRILINRYSKPSRLYININGHINHSHKNAINAIKSHQIWWHYVYTFEPFMLNAILNVIFVINHSSSSHHFGYEEIFLLSLSLYLFRFLVILSTV